MRKRVFLPQNREHFPVNREVNSDPSQSDPSLYRDKNEVNYHS